MSLEKKYIFGVKLEDGTCTIAIAVKDEWIKSNNYVCIITDELENIMDYFGFEKSSHDWEFINESEDRTINEIIDNLNKSPMLEYNHDFNDFALSYVYCIEKEEYSEESEIAVSVTPMLYWINKNHQSDEATDSYIVNFFKAIDFEEVEDSTFTYDNEDDTYDETTLKKELDSYKYLKHDISFDNFINKR